MQPSGLRHRLTSLAIAVTAFAAHAFPAAASPPPQDQPAAPPARDEQPAALPDTVFEDEVEVIEVLLDVIVTDSSGRMVADLQPSDLVVLEDGEVREILHMSFVEHAALIERESISVWSGDSLIDLRLDEAGGEQVGEDQVGGETPGPPRRLFILFFHQHHFGLAGRMVHSGHQAGRWIREAMAPGDLVAVVAYDNKLELHQDFTADLAAAARAALAAATRDPAERRPADPGAPSLFDYFPRSDRRLVKRTSRPSKGIKELARAAGRIPGRKHLFLFSWGQSLQLRHPGLLDRRFEPTMLEVLNDNNLAVHSVGLHMPEIGPSDVSPELDTLSQGTGGVYLSPRNTFEGTLRSTSKHIDGVYLVSFRTHIPKATAGYREVRVLPRNEQFLVHSRQGYLFGDP